LSGGIFHFRLVSANLFILEKGDSVRSHLGGMFPLNVVADAVISDKFSEGYEFFQLILFIFPVFPATQEGLMTSISS